MWCVGGQVHTNVVCWVGEFTQMWCVGWVIHADECVGWMSSHRCNVLGGQSHTDVV